MKQCGRLDLPCLQNFPHLEEIFGAPYTYLFGDIRPHAKWIKPCENVVFITGPEKGFSEKETKILEKKAIGVRLHRNILRAETAPIAALCFLQ